MMQRSWAWPAAIAVLSVGTMLLAVLLTLRIAIEYPQNHWACDIRMFWVWCVCLATISVVAASKGRLAWKWAWVAIASSLYLASVVWFADHYNLLLDYHLWIRRGFPGPRL